MTRPVVVLGDVNVDLSLALPDRSLPRPERTLSEPQMGGGGTGGNTAAALAVLGVPVEFHGTVGDDGFGRWLTADFQRVGVGMRGLVVLPEAITAEVIALLEPDGERYLVIWPTRDGAHTHMRPEHLHEELLTTAAWVHTTGMCLRASPLKETILAGMTLAHAAGVPTSLDFNLRIELWGLSDEVRATLEGVITQCDVVLGSGPEEIMPVARAATLDEAMETLSGGVRTVVARLGAEGAIARTPEGQTVRAPAFPAHVVNTVGAGDAFNGGFITAQVEGKPLADALRWGNAVAALKVGRAGGARDLPARGEVEALLGISD